MNGAAGLKILEFFPNKEYPRPMSIQMIINGLTAFDMRTLVFIYLMVAYIAAYVFAVTWRQTRKRFRGIGGFAFYFFLVALGITLSLFRGILPDILTVVGANGLMFAGHICLLPGLARFLGVGLNFRPYLILGLGFIGLYAWFTLGVPDIRMRIILFSACVLPSLVHSVYLIFITADGDHRGYASSVGATLSLFALVYLMRIYFGITAPAPATYFTTPMPDNFFHFLGLGLTILLTLSLHLMINAKLICQAERHARQQEELAARDGLTGLYNRRKISALLEKELYRFRRYGRPFSVILCDIDYFKRVNDTLGHDAGDRVLVSVAAALAGNIRSEDVIGRWGGEEFLILLPETGETKAAETAEKLRHQNVDSQAGKSDGLAPVTISFGVAQGRTGLDLAHLLKHADQALYHAKSSGRNRVACHSRIPNHPN